MSTRPRRNAGFTLIELMVVVVVVGILSSLAIPRYLDYSRSSREAEAKPLLKQIATLIARYQARTGAITTDIALLEGGPDLVTSGKYFTYGVGPHGSGYCIVATPNEQGTAAGLDPQSLDGNGDFHETAGC